ncbi:reverse transcriptase [Senna tora]|uniref:Reverse transcriptase n=1 Tax=Senna tora TaxID=362788 RepID=A0A834TMX4_9FABA|nr:reverse transcriptase [Senna tora]
MYEANVIREHIICYFQDCFQNNPTSDFPILVHSSRIENSHHPHLEATPTPKEIKKALWDLKPFKAAGIDGFQPGFFQRCWGFLEKRFDRDSINAVKHVLDDFLHSSGLSVNNSKSSIWFAPSTPEAEKRLVMRRFSFKVETKPGTYLGHSLGIGNKISDFKPIIDKLVGKMDFWNSKFLSKAGRATLLNSVGSPLLAYYLQNLKLPVSVYNSIKRIQRNFFWKSGNKQSIRKINWETICKPKWLGGLGIGRVKERNHALLAKLSWRVSNENQQVWAKLMKIYNQESKTNGSAVGKGIKWGLSLLELGLHSVIYSGKDTSIWKDTWVGSTPIRQLICGPLNLHEDNLSVNNFADDLVLASCGRNTYIKSVEFSHLAKDVSPFPSKGHIWVKWTAPSEGWWKLNTDGACARNPSKMAAAGVFRDSNGNWIQGGRRIKSDAFYIQKEDRIVISNVPREPFYRTRIASTASNELQYKKKERKILTKGTLFGSLQLHYSFNFKRQNPL